MRPRRPVETLEVPAVDLVTVAVESAAAGHHALFLVTSQGQGSKAARRIADSAGPLVERATPTDIRLLGGGRVSVRMAADVRSLVADVAVLAGPLSVRDWDRFMPALLAAESPRVVLARAPQPQPAR